MDNDNKKASDTNKINEHTDMPVKTVGTDHEKKSAGEPGLNQAGTTDNEMEPGTKTEDPKSTENS